MPARSKERAPDIWESPDAKLAVDRENYRSWRALAREWKQLADSEARGRDRRLKFMRYCIEQFKTIAEKHENIPVQ